MKKIAVEKTYNVTYELNEKDINILKSALHEIYMKYKKSGLMPEYDLNLIRVMRNDFAGLVNCCYMGEDA